MLVRIYGSYMVDIAIFFGAKHDVAVKELSDALDFEIELAKVRKEAMYTVLVKRDTICLSF